MAEIRKGRIEHELDLTLEQLAMVATAVNQFTAGVAMLSGSTQNRVQPDAYTSFGAALQAIHNALLAVEDRLAGCARLATAYQAAQN